ncbi:MAG: cation diffusion facilitator family transporter [Calditrichia bacterium]
MEEINHRTQEATRVTWVGFFVNIFLTVFKFAAGILGQSAAMIADAIHSLSDFASDIVVLLGFRIVNKPIDESHDYGHGKFETLSTTFIGLMLFFVGLGILWSGIEEIWRAFHGIRIHAPGQIALFAAVVSIISKELLFRYTRKVGQRINSSAVIANAWHHRTDVLSSIGTMFGIGGAIILGEKWRILDPLAAVVVSFFIIKVAVEITRQSLNELLEASVDEKTKNRIIRIAHEIEGAEHPHDLRTRKIGNSIAIDLHVKVNEKLTIVEAHDISTKIEEALRKEFGNDTFISVHVEPLND